MDIGSLSYRGGLNRAPTTKTGPVKSLAKALDVLACFSEEKPEWSVSDLARHLNLPKSTVSNILATFRQRDIVRQISNTGRYRLGLYCLELGYYASSQLLLRDVAYPYLQALLEDTQQIIYLGLPYQGEVLYIEALYPIHRRINFSSIGRKAPMYCTAIGKAMLSHMPIDEIEGFLERTPLHPHTPNTITDPNKLLQELTDTRVRGYAIDAEEREIGIRCVAAPVLNSQGIAYAAISVSGPESEFTHDQIETYGTRVKIITHELSRKLRSVGL